MQKLFIIAALAMALPVLAQAQEAPRTEFFGGYSYMRSGEIDPRNPEDLDLNGYNVSGAVTVFKKYLSVKVDISGHFGDVLPDVPQLQIKQGRTLFLAGPQITLRKNERFQPFAHLLFGAGRFRVETDTAMAAEIGFAMAFGGGVDVKTPLGKKVAVRVFQVDYVRTKFEATNLRVSALRVSAGIVLRF